MMLNNIFDYMIDDKGEFFRTAFHIPSHKFYVEVGFPFFIDNESGILYDNSGEPAILTVDLIDSMEWEYIDE